MRRFWDKVDRSGDCWVWMASKRGHGYGGFLTPERKPTTAHRFSWFLHNGPIPSGMCVLHKCDNRLCVKPDHLFLGTQLDNIRDRDEKGRQKTLRGSVNINAKLNEDQVKIIKRNRGFISQRCLAKAFGVTRGTITHIHTGRNWGHI